MPMRRTSRARQKCQGRACSGRRARRCRSACRRRRPSARSRICAPPSAPPALLQLRNYLTTKSSLSSHCVTLCASRTLSCSRTHIIVPDMRIDMFCPKRPSRTTACTYSKRFLLTKTYICNRIDQFSVRLSTAKTDKTGSVEKSAPLRRG